MTSQERARALEARGKEKLAALEPELDAAFNAALDATVLHQQAQEALLQAQQAHAATEANLRTRQETVDALRLKGAALDGAIRAANNAGDIYGAIEQLGAGEVAAEVIAPIEKQAQDLEAQAQAVIGEAPPNLAISPEVAEVAARVAEIVTPLLGEDGQPLAPPAGDLASDLASPQPIATGDGQ